MWEWDRVQQREGNRRRRGAAQLQRLLHSRQAGLVCTVRDSRIHNPHVAHGTAPPARLAPTT